MESYEAIVQRMRESYISYAGFTPAEESDIMIRLRVLAGEIYQAQVSADYITRQLFAQTAEGIYLDRHAAERGLTRRAAATASGGVGFFPDSEEHGDILIPSGTVVCTGATLLRYHTTEDAVLHSGESYVYAPVIADAPGAAYNARGGTIDILVTPVMGIGRVYNGSPIANGVDEESDDELRTRIIDSYVNISNGANAAYYKRLAMSVQGVYSASAVGRVRGDGTVSVYLSGRGDAVTAAVKAQVQALLNEGSELNVDVQAVDAEDAEITLYIIMSVLPGYDFDTVAAQVRQAVSDHINGLGIGGDVYLSDIGEVIYHIEGVENYRFLESHGSDRQIGDDTYPYAGTIIVREAS